MLSATRRKGRGAFSSPPEMVVPMVTWAVREPSDSVLDGGAGESVFLVAATERLLHLGARRDRVLDQVQGVELDELAADLAAKTLAGAIDGDPEDAPIKRGSFFDETPGRSLPMVTACIGNPPYIRYQSFSGAVRKQALSRAAEGGVKLNGLTSSWAPFVVHACRFLSPGGRLAQVLPAELLHTGYAQPIRNFLVQRFHSVTLLVFDARVFPGALEEVVLVLASDEGQPGLQVREASDLNDLDRIVHNGSSRTRTVRNPKGKWSKYLLQHAELSAYESLSRDPRIARLDSYGTTDIGVVTGANDFFVLDEQTVDKAEIPLADLLPAVAKAEHIQGLRLARSDVSRMRSANEACFLFYPSDGDLSPPSARYIRSGEWVGLHHRYKCRTRRPWWRVPGVKVPEIFITYMASEVPRIVVNEIGAISTNTVHRFFLRNDAKETKKLLPLVALNSLTLLSAEIEGRSYGGGVLKLEPKECDRLLIPRIEELHKEEAAAIRSLFLSADRAIREGGLAQVIDEVDEIVLQQALDLSPKVIQRLRNARSRLLGRRLARMRTKPI